MASPRRSTPRARTQRAPATPARRPHPLTKLDRVVFTRLARALPMKEADARRALVVIAWLAVFVAFLLVAGGIGW